MEKSITNFYKINHFYDWMKKTNQAKILKLKLTAQQLYDLQIHKSNLGKYHNALYEGYTNIIDKFVETNEMIKTNYMNGSFSRSNVWKCYPHDDHQSYWLYRTMKMYWLYESIKNDCQHAPIQMHRFRDGYRFHPGSDKVNSLYLMGKINNLVTNVFYIWYPEIDPDFEEWNLDYEIINTGEEFRDMFVKYHDNTFNIISGKTKIGSNYDYAKSDKHLEVSSWYAAESMRYDRNEKLPLKIDHISYNDNIHHIGIDLSIKKIKEFKYTDETFTLPNGIKFIKKDTTLDIGSKRQYSQMWIPECDMDMDDEGDENL